MKMFKIIQYTNRKTTSFSGDFSMNDDSAEYSSFFNIFCFKYGGLFSARRHQHYVIVLLTSRIVVGRIKVNVFV